MELQQAVEGSDVADIQAKTEALERGDTVALRRRSTRRRPRRPPRSRRRNGGATEDEVVEDADFEVIDEEEAAKS